jgi:hypothetical protein
MKNQKKGVWAFSSFCANSWDRLMGRESNLQFVERDGWLYCQKMVSGLMKKKLEGYGS